MSQKSAKKLRRLARKTFRYHYNEFLNEVAKLKLSDRIRIAWQVIKKQREEKKMDRFITNIIFPGFIYFFFVSGVGAWVFIIADLLGAW